MLGLPPAFVLSQDQTLKLKSNYLLILDVRTSAHIVPTIRSELSHLGLTETKMRFSVCCASGYQSNRKPRQTVKLTLDHRHKATSAIHVQLFVHRMNQTAHISLQCLQFSNNVRTKRPERQNLPEAPKFPGATRLSCLKISPKPRFRTLARRSVWRPVSASAPPVRGFYGLPPIPATPFLQKRHLFSNFLIFSMF